MGKKNKKQHVFLLHELCLLHIIPILCIMHLGHNLNFYFLLISLTFSNFNPISLLYNQVYPLLFYLPHSPLFPLYLTWLLLFTLSQTLCVICLLFLTQFLTSQLTLRFPPHFLQLLVFWSALIDFNCISMSTFGFLFSLLQKFVFQLLSGVGS